MAFENDVVGGITLVRPAIRSANYVAGVSGWSINVDGTAEFASGTFRGPVVIIDPITQNVLASIGADGNGSFQNVTVTSDIILGTTSLANFIDITPKGPVSLINLFGSAMPAPGNGSGNTPTVWTDTAWIEFRNVSGRAYKIETNPVPMFNSAVTAASCGLQILGVQVVGQPTAFTGLVSQVYESVDTWASPIIMSIFIWATTTIQRLQLQASRANTVITLPNPGTFIWVVSDYAKVGNYGTKGSLGTASGGAVVTNDYVCSNSQSYDGSGNPIPAPDGTQNVYQSQFPDRTFGNEVSMCIFPGATIRTDLTGATVLAADMWFYCIKAEEAQGTLAYRSESNTIPPATYSPGTSNQYGADDAWPVPGWHSISMLTGGTTHLSRILGGDNAVGLTQIIFGLAATGYHGFGFSSSFRPFMRITFQQP